MAVETPASAPAPTPASTAAASLRITPTWAMGSRRARHLVERNAYAYRRMWVMFVSGFFEPVFYLLSVTVGISRLAGTVAVGGRVITYTAFVAPGLMASAAMNGAVMDGTFAVFFKLKFAKVYHAILATPLNAGDVALGEISWAVLRGGAYSSGFMVVMAAMGLVGSPWALLAVPAALLEAFAFAAVAMACTTFMRSWQDFDFVTLALIPMFLFSATFYPLSVYPPALQTVVRLVPLYQAVALIRGFDLGIVGWSMLGHAAYLAVMAVVGLRIAS
ncbi:MAG TPA: ABC transporter permease, partial [Acidimicrobiales bacterium]|nr:ABC transporter permease [Acidimicrobiales bacterium]